MPTPEEFFHESEHLDDEGVALFVDALKLNALEQLPASVRDHVAGCHECKQNITGLFALLDDVSYSNVRSHPSFSLAGGTGSGVSLVMKLAAVIAGVAILATLTYLLGPFREGETGRRTSQRSSEGVVDSLQKGEAAGRESVTVPKEVFAADFTADPELEDLVNGRSRSAAFSVISPANGSVLGSDAVFTWKGEGRKSLTLSIMDNKGGVVLTGRALPSQFVLRQRLNPGLYYWKIESESELLYVGKFFVK